MLSGGRSSGRRLGSARQDTIGGTDQAFHVVIEVASGIDFHGIAKREFLQARWQVGRLWHARVVDKHGNQRNSSLQRRLDLHPDRIALVVDSRLTGLRLAKPSLADHDQQDIALQQSPPDMFAEVGAERNIVDIDEHGLFAVMRNQPIKNTAGHSRRIRPAIGNQDPRHCLPSFGVLPSAFLEFQDT